MSEIIIRQTRQWLTDVVISHDFCPFARKVLLQEGIRFVVFSDSKKKQVLQQLLEECSLLKQRPDIETSLLILSSAGADFYDFLDLLSMADELLRLEGYEGIYQLASFHPDYMFEGLDHDDPANYTNRSPYPVLHLLREDRLEKAVNAYPEPEAIPERNIVQARALGQGYFEDILKRIRE